MSSSHRNPIRTKHLRSVTKRVFDLLLSALFLVLSLPVLLISIIVIRLTSGGPALFKQVRVGLNGKTFTCYKLRTLKGSPSKAFLHEIPQECLIVPGNFLRKSKIDELPQLFNVLKGEMTLVGPRPCLPIYSEVIAERETLNVFDAIPGITGLAQINYIDMRTPKEIAECDSDYIQRQSFLFDLEILLRTIPMFFRNPPSKPLTGPDDNRTFPENPVSSKSHTTK